MPAVTRGASLLDAASDELDGGWLGPATITAYPGSLSIAIRSPRQNPLDSDVTSGPKMRRTEVIASMLKIGELARKTGLSVRTLHHYDSIGLLSPAVWSGKRQAFDREPGLVVGMGLDASLLAFLKGVLMPPMKDAS